MPKVEKKLTFTEYTAMKAADLFKHVAEVAVKPVEALNKATDKVVSNLKDAAKAVAAMKRLHNERINARATPGEEDESSSAKPVVAITPALAAEYLIAAIKQAQEKNADEQYELCCAVWNINNAWAGLPEKMTRALDAKYQKAAKQGVAPHV